MPDAKKMPCGKLPAGHCFLSQGFSDELLELVEQVRELARCGIDRLLGGHVNTCALESLDRELGSAGLQEAQIILKLLLSSVEDAL